MKKNFKGIVIAMLISISTIGLIGCNGGDSNSTELDTINKVESVRYIYSNLGESHEVVIDKPRERAVTLSQFMTEMLLALGLEDKMVGTALLDNPILPEFKDAYDKIPVLEIGEGHYISKEAFIAIEADFVSGWDSSISEETTGSAKDIIGKGIAPFMAKSYGSDSTVDDVYEDFELLGKIFGVEDKANEVIEKMKEDIKLVTDKTSNIKEEDRVKVMVYDSGEQDAFVVGGGLANNLITLAGGKNVYGKDAKKPYINISFESIIQNNPEVILVTDFMAGDAVENKIKFLKSHPALKDVSAIKNNNIYVVELADLSPGVRNPKIIDEMYGYFYGENN